MRQESGAYAVKNLKVTPLLLSVVAGMGHLWEGRDLKGLVIFATFAAGCAGILEGTLLWSGPGKTTILVLALLVTLGVWAYAFIDILRLTYEPWREKNRLRRGEHLRQGILSFLKSDYETAEREFLANLRIEPGDPESLFRLAHVARIRGEYARARRYLRALRRTDLDEKWGWERSQEEALIAELEREEKERGAPERAAENAEPDRLPAAVRAAAAALATGGAGASEEEAASEEEEEEDQEPLEFNHDAEGSAGERT
jgi:hypothetical protein